MGATPKTTPIGENGLTEIAIVVDLANLKITAGCCAVCRLRNLGQILRCVGLPESDQRWRERNRIHDVQIGAQHRLDRCGARPRPGKPEDLRSLIDGLMEFAERSETGGLDPIVSAACLAFGFVFIRPFEVGNGRIHRWLLHHVLARRGFTPAGINFPISAIFLERIEAYRATLEHYSRPRLALTEWETTRDPNVRLLNETRDQFRFFGATRQGEFLSADVLETVRNTLPREIEYLRSYDLAKGRIQNFLEMPEHRFD
jgi:Fic family protein